MRRYTIITLFFTFFYSSTFAQITIYGKVLNKDTKEPIVYANIGIVNSNIGTISNLDGTFSLLIPQKLSSDTLTFSAIGFEKKALPLSSLNRQENLSIYLDERVIHLKTITVHKKREKNKTFELGNSTFKGGVLETDTTYAGGSTALLIENKEPNFHKDLIFPVYLEKASLRILRNNLPSFKFRIRLQEVDSLTGQPAEDMLNESIIVESTKRNGWLEFDLSHLNFQIYQPFFVTFEQILDLNDRTAIADGYRKFIEENPKKLKIDTVLFEGKKEVRQILTGNGIDLPGTFIAINSDKSAPDVYTCYVRETSLGEWKKVRGIVTATVLLSNQLNASSNKK